MIEHTYIHIPFCIRKCRYCSFVSGFDINHKAAYLNSLLKQIKREYKHEKLKTLYIGGGTPSLLRPKEIEILLNCFNFHQNCEVTLEVNPETVSLEKFKKYKDIGINRISLGVQTFNDNILKQIGRNHSSKDIYSAIENIKKAEFKNINIDLIYGLPKQTISEFEQDIQKAIALNIEHISSYGLKIEENSYFYNNKPQNLPDDEIQANMYLKLCEVLAKHNFEHYEISNFAKKGFSSKHNNAYWKNKRYYGFGLNASGYIENTRYRNCADLNEYINNPLKKEEEIYISKKEEAENEIFLALRLKDGININLFNEKFNMDFERKYRNILEKYKNLQLIEIKNKICRLTKDGILLSNDIMSEFLD